MQQESSFNDTEQPQPYTVRNVNGDPREQKPQQEQPSQEYQGYRGQEFYTVPEPQAMMGEKIMPQQRPRSRHRGRAGIIALVLILLLLAVGGGMSILSFVGGAGKAETKTFTLSSASAHPRLVIRDSNGRVHIHTGSGAALVVEAEEQVTGINAHLEDVKLAYHQDGDVLNIDAEQNGFLFLGSRAVNLDITVPATSDIDLQSGSGSVDLASVQGQVALQTGSGAITVSNLSGPTTLQTGSGAIRASNINGAMTWHTGSGAIEASNITGSINADTGSGGITLQQAQLDGPSRLETGSGAISFDGSLIAGKSYQFQTGSGSVDVTLPASSAFTLNASSHSGSVNNDFDSNTVGSGPRADVSVQTGSGSISVHKGP